MEHRKLSVVIPCYRSEHSILTVVDETISTLAKRPEYSYEIILINDGSPDGTWDVIRHITQVYPHIKAINLSKNYGQHSALLAGYRAVTGDIVVGMDDDGEHDPKRLFALVDKLDEGYDYVCAHFSENPPRGIRKLGTKANAKMAETLIDKPKTAELSSFYAERRFVTDYIAKCSNPMPYIAGLLLQATHNMGTVEIPKRNRIQGSSGYTLKKLLALWINGFTAFSVKPLRVATITGLITAFVGFIFGAYVVIRRLCNPNILLGYSSLMAVLLFVGGLILCALGMVGEYVGRIYLNVNGIPQYVIREVIQEKEEQKQEACG